jgi:hypothetical protein
MKNRSIMHVVGTECPPERQEEFDRWYNETHIPDVLKFKKLRGVIRMKNLHPGTEYPVFLTIYQFDNEKDYEEYIQSPERAAAGGEWMRVQRELGATRKWSVQYEVTRSWQQ